LSPVFLAEKTAVDSTAGAALLPSGAAQMGQNLNSELATGVPHLGQGGPDGGGGTGSSAVLAPQKAQKGIELSTGCPQLRHLISPAPDADPYTRVAGTPAAPAALARAGAGAAATPPTGV